MMRLSVCIPTYNRGPFIGQTLESIVGQLPADAEVVVVDGGSGDNTADVVTAYAMKYPAIRYIREPNNSGYDRDCDKAVGLAKGEHCWLMSDDDLLAPGAIDRVLLSLEDADIERQWVDEAVRRRDEVRAGKIKAIPAAEVYRRIEQLLAK